MGWASTDKSIELPDKDSLWIASKENFKNEKIKLEWSNNKGLKIIREISFDKNFMITITDQVINGTSETIDLTNFSYLRRKNYEPENKFFILHEGPLGVFNDTLKEVSYDELQENKEIVESTKNGWIGYTDHYWQVAIFPDTNESFKARFKTIENGALTPFMSILLKNGAKRTRTADPLHAMQVLYQLSYGPKPRNVSHINQSKDFFRNVRNSYSTL